MATKQAPTLGMVAWQVEWILSADVPQSFKDDPDRDLADVTKWERLRAFPTKELAMAFAKSLRGLFFGGCTVVKLTYAVDGEFPEFGPEWQHGEEIAIDEEESP